MTFRLFRNVTLSDPPRTMIFGCAAGLLLVMPRVVSAQGVTEPAQDPLAGSEVFVSKGCIECHAVKGMGGNRGPDLAHIPRRRSFYELAAALWNHVPLVGEGMMESGIEHPEMDEHEAADLIGFLFTLDYFDPPGDVEVGKRLFSEKRCIACHRVGSYGGETGPSLDFVGRYGSPILVAASMWNHSGAMAEAAEAKGVERPTFQGSELVDLIAFLESAAPQPVEGRVYVLPGRAEAGRVVFVEKRCQDCHSVQGVGGRIGPDLAATGRRWSLTDFAAAMWNKAPAMLEAQEANGIRTPSLGATEMADLVAYLYAIDYFAELGDPERGEQYLADSDCLSCHSIGGSGGILAKDFHQMREMVSPAEVSAALWNHSLLIGSGAEALQGPWPKLGPAELADIMAYLQAPASGG